MKKLHNAIRNDKEKIYATTNDWRWAKKHGYASIIDGQKYMLFNENGATVLKPVNVVKKEIYVNQKKNR